MSPLGSVLPISPVHNDRITGLRKEFCSGRDMYDRGVFDLELSPGYLRVHALSPATKVQ